MPAPYKTPATTNTERSQSAWWFTKEFLLAGKSAAL
jgi:hypothetical protein